MNTKLIFAAVGLASGLAGKLYVNRIMDKAAKSLTTSRLAQNGTVVLADIPEAPNRTLRRPSSSSAPPHTSDQSHIHPHTVDWVF